MASESEAIEQTLVDRLINSRNRDLSLLLPVMLGLTNEIATNTNPFQEPLEEDQEQPETGSSRNRVVLINPLTQGMVVIEGSSGGLDSLLENIMSSKEGQSPASRASIEALPSVEIRDDGEEKGECVICLEDWKVGEVVKELPCEHRFHGDCIEKWLRIHGSCPLCRYRMPVDEDDWVKKSAEGRDGRREIWVSFSFSGERRSGESNQTDSTQSTDSSPIPPRPDPELEN